MSRRLRILYLKKVYSRIKFEQMIGRGTRLCENLLERVETRRSFTSLIICVIFNFLAKIQRKRAGSKYCSCVGKVYTHGTDY